MENFHICPLCHYRSPKVYNLKRHIVLKHNVNENISVSENAVINSDTVVINRTSEDELENRNPLDCNKCNRHFRDYKWLEKHVANCQGVDCKTCPYCKETFYDRSNKYRHVKTCKVKKEMDRNVNAVEAGGVGDVGASITNNNIQNQTNIQNQNNTNINNQNNVNIIVFDPSHMEFLTDHIDLAKLTKLISRDLKRPEDRQEPREIMSTYSRELMERPENRCIQKNNLRTNYAKIHIGENKWRSVLDCDIFPKLVCNIANGFQDFLQGRSGDVKKNIHAYIEQRMIPFLDYMADNGYCSDEARAKTIMEEFNLLVQQLKLVTFDFTHKKRIEDETDAGDGDPVMVSV